MSLLKKEIESDLYGDKIKRSYLKLEEDSKHSWEAKIILLMLEKYGLMDDDFLICLSVKKNYQDTLKLLIESGYKPL